MLRVGITGGMGSGKSTVARMFGLLGVPLYFADDEAKKIMQFDRVVKAKIIEIFGREAYTENTLNRPYIAQVAFSNPEKLQALNATVHPAVIAHGENWMAQQTSPYALKEAALIFESDSQKQLDKVIGIWSPLELRISRIMQRDGANRKGILERMEKQMNEEEKMKRCDFVIINDEKSALIPQVLSLHALLAGHTL